MDIQSLDTISISSYEKIETGICPKLLKFLNVYCSKSKYAYFYNEIDLNDKVFFWGTSRPNEYKLFIEILKFYNLNFNIEKVKKKNNGVSFYKISLIL